MFVLFVVPISHFYVVTFTYTFWEILQWLKKIGAVHLIKSYGSEGRMYPKVPKVKYLVLSKCGTKYQKVESNTNLI